MVCVYRIPGGFQRIGLLLPLFPKIKQPMCTSCQNDSGSKGISSELNQQTEVGCAETDLGIFESGSGCQTELPICGSTAAALGGGMERFIWTTPNATNDLKEIFAACWSLHQVREN
jgi:hypothetical protein